MIALAGIGGGLHLAKQRIHLGIIELTTSPHRSVAGDRRQHMRDPVFQRAAPSHLDKLFGDIPHQKGRIRRAKKRGNTSYQNAAVAKPFDFKPEAGQKFGLGKDRLSLVSSQIDNIRYQQRLHGHTALLHRCLHPFHHQPFMRCMLVDDGNAIACLGHDLGLVQLRPRRAKHCINSGVIHRHRGGRPGCRRQIAHHARL